MALVKANDFNVNDIIVVKQISGQKYFVNQSPEEVRLLIGADPNIINVKAGDDLPAIAAAATTGQLIVVGPGTYALGSEQIILKTGVNWEFKGFPTISSSHANGTFYDNNVNVQVKFEGEPVITNTNGVEKSILLLNSASKLTGTYSKEIYARLPFPSQTTINADGTYFEITTYKNNIGELISERLGVGSYRITLPLSNSNLHIFSQITLETRSYLPIVYLRIAPNSSRSQINITVFDSSGTQVDPVGNAYKAKFKYIYFDL